MEPKMEELLRATGVPREHYDAAVKRIAQERVSVPGRRRAAFGYALALWDVERSASLETQVDAATRRAKVCRTSFLIGTLFGVLAGSMAAMLIVVGLS